MQEIPAYWNETLDERPRFRVARVAFTLGGIALGLLAIDGFARTFARIQRDRGLERFLSSPLWDWAVGMPITLGSLFAAYLLLGRFAVEGWSRRAWLLAAMNSVDLLFWSADHAEILGLPPGVQVLNDIRIRILLGTPLNLAELIVLSSLALSVIEQLSEGHDAAKRHRSTKIAASVSIIMWLFVQLNIWGFRFGWPPPFLGIRDFGTFQLYLGSNLALSVTSMLTTLTCFQAAFLCGRKLGQLEEKHIEDDPFRF